MSTELEEQAEQALRDAGSQNAHGRFNDFMSALERMAQSGQRFDEMRDFAARTAPLFAQAADEVDGWKSVWADGIYSGGEEEALRSLHRRSQVEYARELYADTEAAGVFAEFSDEEMDNDLHERAEFLALDAPAYVPESHTWWRRHADKPVTPSQSPRVTRSSANRQPVHWVKVAGGHCRLGLTAEEATALALACAEATLRWVKSDPDASMRDVSDAERFGGNPAYLEPLVRAAFPAREVVLPAFEIRATPVTHDEYAEFVAATGARAPTSRAVSGHPVVGVSWEEANAFASWANASLPDEWQWERAARGSSVALFPWGNDFGDRRAWLLTQDFYVGWTVGTHGELATNEGVHDMLTERWEWTSSVFSANDISLAALRKLYPGLDPTGRVRRGGRGEHLAPVPVARSGADPTWQADGTGFRLVRLLQ